ncbi:MAG: hypothetical protein WA993_13040 [Candidatus Binatus sp.]|jgi:hypothetical protein|uniref:hypothetical protein n=1 Tax=Candidatus Binatus sp. TaxID=2811406 RepID=UPI003C8D3DCD
MKTSRYLSAFVAVAAASLFFATSALATSSLPLPTAISGRGSGTEVGGAGSCNNGTNGCTGMSGSCECYEFSGTGTANGGIGTVLFSTDFILVIGVQISLPCESAYGTLLLTQKSNSSNVLALDYQGLDCLNISGTEFVFNGGFSVNTTASLGKFTNALGNGTFSAGISETGTVTIGGINGTLELVK